MKVLLIFISCFLGEIIALDIHGVKQVAVFAEDQNSPRLMLDDLFMVNRDTGGCRTPRRCGDEGGICVKDGLCKTHEISNKKPPKNLCKLSDINASIGCRCCLKSVTSCETPYCSLKGGFCLPNNAKARDCPANLFVKTDDCTSKCFCCVRKERNCKCGKVYQASTSTEGRVQGNPISAHKYPWLVFIECPCQKRKRQGEFKTICTGTILHSQFIITDSSCFDSVANHTDCRVRVGDHNIMSSDDDIPEITRTAEIDQIFVKNRTNSLINPIALLKLNERLSLNQYPELQRVCLPPASDYIGKTGVVIGWGERKLKFKAPNPCKGPKGQYKDPITIPYEANVTIYNNSSEYDIKYKKRKYTPMPSDMFCAGSENDQYVMKGDRGSSLTVAVDTEDCGAQHVLVGLTTEYLCNDGQNKLVAYHRITDNLNWIFSIILES